MAEQRPTRAELEAENQRLKQRVAELEKRVDRLLKRVEEAERAAKRQASPFRKKDNDAPAKAKKKRGRKPGKGKWCRREHPETVDEVLEAPTPACCPDCGGAVTESDVAEQFQAELPRIEPVIRKFEIGVGHCSDCGRRVQGRHPKQTSDALGGAAVQIGPNALSLATLLSKQCGTSWRRLASLFGRVFNLHVSPSGLCRASTGRLAKRAEKLYEGLVAELRASGAVHADETSWRVDGVNNWLWVFTNKTTTVYAIAPSRGRDVAFAILGEDFAGILGRDGWSVYRKLEKARHQTCLAHLFRRVHGILEEAKRGEARFPRAVLRFLKKALALRDDQRKYTDHGFKVQRGKLVSQLHQLLRWKCTTFDPNRRLADHLRREADAILTFLFHPEIEAANWPAEQAIRPAIVNRKLSGGNRSARGAKAQAVLTSLIATCTQRGLDVLNVFRQLFRGAQPSLAPPAPI